MGTTVYSAISCNHEMVPTVCTTGRRLFNDYCDFSVYQHNFRRCGLLFICSMVGRRLCSLFLEHIAYVVRYAHVIILKCTYPPLADPGGAGGAMAPSPCGKCSECTKSRHFQTQNRKKFLGRGQCQLVFLCIA